MGVVARGEEHVVALAARESVAALVFREVEEFVGERVVRCDGCVEVDALQGDALIFRLGKCLPVDGDAGGRGGRGVLTFFLRKRHSGHAPGNKCERARDGDDLHP